MSFVKPEKQSSSASERRGARTIEISEKNLERLREAELKRQREAEFKRQREAEKDSKLKTMV